MHHHTPILVFLALLAVSQSTFLLPYNTPLNVIQSMIQLEQPANLSTAFCSDVILNYCQSTFNQQVGGEQSLSFRNGTYLFNRVQMQLDASSASLQNTCNSFNSFAQCLGSYFGKCMNLYTLYHKPAVEASNVFDYIRTMRGLQYMCSTGNNTIVGNYDCLKTVPQSTAYGACTDTYQSTVNVGNLCMMVDQTGHCLNNIYNSACGASSYGCMNFYTAFAPSCWGVKCMSN